MSGFLGGIAGVAFQNNAIAQPLFLKTPHAPNSNPTRVSIAINWADYGAPATNAIGVNVNLTQGSNQQNLIDSIRSVYIDNTFSDVAVYVYFADSGFLAVAAPNSVTIQPVITSLRQALIYSEGFTDVAPSVTVIFTNAELNPYFIDTNFLLPPVLTYVGDNTAPVFDAAGLTVTFNNTILGAPSQQRNNIFVCNYFTSVGGGKVTGVSINGGPVLTPLISLGTGNSGLAMITYENGDLPTLASIKWIFSANLAGNAVQNNYALTRYQNAAPVNSAFKADAANTAETINIAMPRTAVGVFAGQTTAGGAAPTMVGTNIDANGALTGGRNWVVSSVTSPIDQTLTVTNNGEALAGLAFV